MTIRKATEVRLALSFVEEYMPSGQKWRRTAVAFTGIPHGPLYSTQHLVLDKSAAAMETMEERVWSTVFHTEETPCFF